ncbi:MAG: phosphate ABC transporter substrate-binding protein, partial [Eubacteriales bacterium]|nr:phosphate ABC transporter substrate-binding protein [Eubacteriales bacterium]
SSKSETVSTNGSTSMEEVMGALSEQYQKDNSGVTVTYDPTGSGTGIEEVKNGNTDIGLSSRALKDDEKDGLEQKVIALDGISVIVNAKNGVKDLTTQQVADIFSGKITNWSQVGGKDGKISCIGRESGSGTRDGFESATGTEDKCKLEQELTSTGAVISAVGSNENAIGYASFSAVEGQKDIQGIKVNGVSCNEDTIKDGSYKLQRPFCFITSKDNKLSDEAQKFYDFATSKDAADLIRNAGAVPVNE